MNLHAFCYLGLVLYPEQLEACLALFPDETRAQAADILAGLKDLPKEELLRRWSRLRDEERAAARHRTYQQFGVPLDDMAPPVREWCRSRLADQKNG